MESNKRLEELEDFYRKVLESRERIKEVISSFPPDLSEIYALSSKMLSENVVDNVDRTDDALLKTAYESLVDLIDKVYGSGKGKLVISKLEELKTFEYSLMALRKLRDHYFHSINVYILGSLINSFLIKGIIRGDEDLCRKISFSWMAASLLHDIGYIYERREILREVFPSFHEFIHFAQPWMLLPIMRETAKCYEEIVKENMKTLGFNSSIENHHNWSANESVSFKIPKGMLAQKFLYALHDILSTGKGSHGLISAYITMRALLYENKYTKYDYWGEMYYQPLVMSCFAQTYHSLINMCRKVPLMLRKTDRILDQINISSVSYIPILLIIIDEIIDFGRLSLTRGRGHETSRWTIDKIDVEENEISITLRNNLLDVTLGYKLKSKLSKIFQTKEISSSEIQVTREIQTSNQRYTKTRYLDSCIEIVFRGHFFAEKFSRAIYKVFKIRIEDKKDGDNSIKTNIVFTASCKDQH